MAVVPVKSVSNRILRFQAKPEKKRPLAKLVEEIESDYQFRLGVLAIMAICQAASTNISADQVRAEPLAKNLEEQYQLAQNSALTAFGFGRTAFEKTYRFDEETGLAIIDELSPIPFDQSEMLLDRNGEFDGVILKLIDRSIRLDKKRTWWFALDPTALEPHGRSRYLGAPQKVLDARLRLEELEKIWFERFAIGHGIGRAPEKPVKRAAFADEGDIGELDQSGQLIDPMSKMQEALELVEAGGQIILSSERDPETGELLYDYERAEGQPDGRPLENRRKILDNAALRSLGIPERALTQDTAGAGFGASGSQALARVHRQILNKTCSDILGQLNRSYNEGVVQPAVELNYPKLNRPKLSVSSRIEEEGSSEQLSSIARTILDTDNISPLITLGIVDIVKLLEKAEIPVSENLQPKLELLKGF